MDPEAEKKHHYKQHQSLMKLLRHNMLNLTKTVCNDRINNPANAVKTRREAALLWSHLDEATADTSCYDCVTLRPGNCTVWFASKVGVRSDVGPKAQHVRRLRQQLEDQYHERRRKLEEGLDQACCRVNKVTGERQCSKQFCHKAIHQSSRSRMGHILRRMHEKGHIEMSVEQKVAVDVISPHLHSDNRCRAKDQHSKKVDPEVSEVECLASSMITHIADKHGISKDGIDEELGKYGLSVASMLARHLQVASSATETMLNFKSNPLFAGLAAKSRERNKATEESRRKLRQRTHPHGRALKSARTAVAEYNGVSGMVTPRPAQSIKSNNHKLRFRAHKWLQNASQFSYLIQKAATSSRVSALMPTIHTQQSASFVESTKESLSAIVNADGSVIGTTIRSASALGDIMERATKLSDRVYQAAKDQENKPTRRRLSERTVSAFYDEVEHRLATNIAANKKLHGRRLEANTVGLTLPEQHVRRNGWIAGALDWHQLVEDIHHASKRIIERQDDRLRHVEEAGYLPSGPLKEAHKTGIALLDLNAPPSKLGNMFRELHAWVTNRHKSTEKRKDHARQMDESRHTPRMKSSDSHESVIGAVVEASVLGNDVISAMCNTLENSNLHRTSHARKLADTFLGAAATVPLLPTSVSNKYSNYPATDGGVNYFKEIMRYVVYGKRLTKHTAHTRPPPTTHYNTALQWSSDVCVCSRRYIFVLSLQSRRDARRRRLWRRHSHSDTSYGPNVFSRKYVLQTI